MMNTLEAGLKNFVEAGKEPKPGKIHFTTYHSSKGLEAQYCLLYGVDRFSTERSDRILMYVGMTRASEKLVIHYEIPEEGLASDILDLTSNVNSKN